MGMVVALGDEVTEHEIGDRVTLEPGVPDMTCRECRAGRYNLCPNFQELRQGEVRLVPTPMGENFSGSCTVTSRNPLIHIGETTATKSG